MLGGPLLLMAGGGLVSARFWRVYISETFTASFSYMGLAEVELKDDLTGGDLTTPADAGTRAFSSTDAGPSNAADKAFNNVSDTGANAWFPNTTIGTPHYIGWEFAEAKSIIQVRLQDVGGSVRTTKAGEVQYSDDGVTYSTAWSFSFATAGGALEWRETTSPAA